MKKEEPKIYVVLMIRQDYSEELILLETENKKEAIDKLNAVDKEWTESAKEQRPFRLSQPHKEIFVSSLILSVRMHEFSLEEYKQIKDPLHNHMKQNGFSGTMKDLFPGA